MSVIKHRSKKFSERKKMDIIRLRDKEKKSFAEIARIMKSVQESCRSCYNRFKLSKKLPVREKMSKRAVTSWMGLKLKQLLRENFKYSFRQLHQKLCEIVPESVHVPSYSAIRRYLLIHGWETVTALNKPLLRKQNVTKRVLFSKNILKKNANYFGKILWSDETSVSLFPKKRSVQIKVHSSVPKEERPRNFTVQAGGKSVMFWGCFAKNFKGPLIVCDKTINSKTYLSMIKKSVIPI
jgi:hypothetical protein